MILEHFEPYWLGTPHKPVIPSHPDINFLVRPIDLEMQEAAQAAYEAEVADVPIGERNMDVQKRGLRAYGRSLLQQGIADWTGFVDGDKQPLAASPQAVASALRSPDIYPWLEALYVMPFLMRNREKNVSAPSAPGTSKKAGTAGRATKVARAKASATNVPTKSTARTPAKAALSGR